MEGFVYLLESNGLYKVGKTDDLTKRFAQYFYHNPFIAKIFVLVTQDPEGLENYFLHKFSNKRIDPVRDWFRLNSDDIQTFITYVEKQSSEHVYHPISRTRAQSENKEIISAIQLLLEQTESEINQSQIRAAMRSNGYSDERIRRTLADMEMKNLVIVRSGNKGAKLYRHLTPLALDSGDSPALPA